jgi:subtilase family serine protease
MIRLFLFLFMFPVVSGHCAVPKHPKVIPTLLWKYGWNDGNLNNTIGGPRFGSALPRPSATLVQGYSPAQMSTAYGIDQIPAAGDGRGKTIAIIDAYGSPNIQSDLNTFCTQFGLPQQNITVLYPYGQPATTDSGWAAETTLDVEWAHSIAPGARIVLIVAPDASSSLDSCISYASTNPAVGATAVSMSWGIDEIASPTFPAYYDPLMANKAITFCASTGDNGAQVQWPCASSNCLAVGGTTLSYNTLTGYSETGWSGSGGGISTEEGIPSWQAGFPGIANPGRSMPDVSMDADPYTGASVYFTDPAGGGGGWYVYGGTSLSAPMWAGVIARSASLGATYTNRFMNTLYGACRTSATYKRTMRDITSGNNGYPCLVGYDLVTGLGSPIVSQVVILTDASSGSLYVGDQNGKVTKVSASGVPSTTQIPLTYALSSASDANGNVYLGDTASGRILRINGTNGSYSTYYSNSTATIGRPAGLAFDANSNLYVADSAKNQILKIATNGISSVFTATNTLKYPAGLGFDGSGNLYVANNGNNSVLKIGTNGVATNFATNFLSKPFGLAVNASGTVYVSNLGNSTVSKFTTNGVGSIALSAGLNSPYGITLDAASNLYIANSGSNNIVKLNTLGVSTNLFISSNPIVNPVTITVGN